MRFRTLTFALAAMLMAAAPSIAQPLVVFSPKEVEIIRAYFAHVHERDAKDNDGSAGAQGSGGKVKGGKQTTQGLPPGIAKNLARGKPLPPGIAKKQLPADLIQRLPPVRSGYERVVIDGRVLLIEIATQMIVDAIFD